ncbi:NAD(P)-dependent oxidoreductase [Rothia kristinae]|uniref:NAD(P)-dependent oxidoreductase n=1 Tax=Rothia kristinae TaxID=37923 RepID=UPI002E2C32B1|nr:NAD(P)H-binding protein [Rothia kristinae]MED6047467.1 NAD(P)H-binding protein [Rothia kristinae]
MKIAVIGATGMIGSRTVAEAVRRGHVVDAYSRSGRTVEGADASAALDLADTAAVIDVIGRHDVTLIAAVSGRGGEMDQNVADHRALIEAAPVGRLVVVGGAGALQADAQTRLKDTPDFPEQFRTEAQTFSDVLDLYRASEGLHWSMLAPAPMIAPGQRTGSYRTELDAPAGESISGEDFAVALVDEAESDAHAGRRFTVAN